jgi:serine/threonine protein phosphatase PrpC
MSSLVVSHGYATLTGPREQNEDFCGLVAPAGAELDNKGILAAIADGVATGGGGRQAAEYTVRGLLADYYATPDTWSTPRALDAVLTAINRWLLAQSTRRAASLATTLSALVLRGRRYVLAHIGDSRIYRLRSGELTQLTRDHTWEHPDLSHVLSRAVGLDTQLTVDYADGELETGDVFLLVTDGLWAPLNPARLHALLANEPDPLQAAKLLVEAALASGGRDNVSAQVLRVDELPESNLDEALALQRDLPIPPPLAVGQHIDRFEVRALLHDSRATRLYEVIDVATGQHYVLKTLKAGAEADTLAFVIEEWLARRVHTRWAPEVLPLSVAERSALYYVMSHHAGDTLEAMLDSGRHFAVADTVSLGVQLTKGLGALHRLDILHRDIKPANLLLCDDGALRILDFGVALNSGAVHDTSTAEGTPGTPSYMSPELHSGEPSTYASDIYAAGVTLYRLLTRHYPYGEIEPFQHPHFGDPVPPTKFRQDIPAWLEAVLLKAVARDPARRFETAEEMLLALERGPQGELNVPRRTPIAERDPVRLWAGIAAASMLLNLLLAWLLMR